MNPWRITPAVKVLLIANCAVWVVEALFINWIASRETAGLALHWFALTPSNVFPYFVGADAHPITFLGVRVPAVWQLVTYLFLHDPSSPMHLLFNMLMLWMLGGLLESRWGSWSFAKFYLICGVGAGVFITVLGVLWPAADASTLGASGAIFGLTVAFGIVFAEMTVYAMMMIPLKARTLMFILIGFQFLLLLTRAPEISVAAHLSGAAIGYLLVTGYWRPSRLLAKYRSHRPPPRKPPKRKKSDYLKIVPREDDEDRGGNGAGKYLH